MASTRQRLKGGSSRKTSQVEKARGILANLEPEFPTVADAILALRSDIDAAIENGHHVGKVYELVAKELKTTAHTVKSVLQRAKRQKRK